MDKYDALLPENYMQLLPQAVKASFESEKFVWGNVPEWIPPKELR
jgi:nucleoporin NUP42